MNIHFINEIRIDKALRAVQDGLFENEGFNTQKNGATICSITFLERKCRAKKNYYELLQIAHFINQLQRNISILKTCCLKVVLILVAGAAGIMGYIRKEIIEILEIRLVMEEYKQLLF